MSTSSRMHWGFYMAVLPADPSIGPSMLKLVTMNTSDEVADNSTIRFEWTHDRVGYLSHPQLQEPLQYLEISGTCEASSESQAQEYCQTLIQTLLEEADDEVGNAELLLLLPGTEIPLLDTALHSQEKFETYGVAKIEQALDDNLVEELKEYCLQTFQRLYEAWQQQSKRHGQEHFREIMARDDKRFDFRLDFLETTTAVVWKDVEQQGAWKETIQNALGQDYSFVKCGCVLSLPGTGMQYWHTDGKSCSSIQAICVFVPLIDLTLETGCTEFWAGSHLATQKLLQKKGPDVALPGGTLGLLRKGEALVYDYRTIHRGTANHTNDRIRPVCYFLYSKAGSETVEDQNFSPKSVFDI